MAYLKKSSVLMIFIVALLLWTNGQTIAQSPNGAPTSDSNLIYTVQPGDTLSLIALRYNLKLMDLLVANRLYSARFVFPGQQLVLPGIPAPEPTPTPIPILLSDDVHTVEPGETIFDIAQEYNIPMGSLVMANSVAEPDLIQPGLELKIPIGPPPTPGPMEAPFAEVALSEPVIVQGRTLVVKVALSEAALLSGSFEGRPLIFSDDGRGGRWSIIAIHALAEPGIYPILLKATLPSGQEVSRIESVTIIEGPYGQENIQLDDQRTELLDPELIAIEREKLLNLWSQVTLHPQWQGPFRYPVAPDTLRITSYFGTRRTYNNSEELSFHGGTDFGGGSGTPIYAPAAGTVVLAEPLIVRGNAVVIDHGMGVYSNYWHQSQIAVRADQKIQAGDLIGYIGNTGLVTGPHLHWELRIYGIAVNPLQWVAEVIPR